MKFLLLLATLFLLDCSFTRVNAYSSGAPQYMCLNPVPHHRNKNGQDVQPTKTYHNFAIKVNATSYKPNDVINVTLSSPLAWKKFEGFILRAVRAEYSSEVLMGEFFDCSTQPHSQFKVLKVPKTSPDNCVMHGEDKDKNYVNCKWRAPPTPHGDIKFQATVVKGYTQFYTCIETKVTSTKGIGSAEMAVKKLLERTRKPVSTSNCGFTHGCVVYPALCIQRGKCSYGVAFRRSGNYLEFELFGNSNGYVSLGFSKDKEMGLDEAVNCAYSKCGQNVSVLASHNPARFNVPIVRTADEFTPLGGLMQQTGVGFTNQEIHCRFRRKISLDTHFSGKTITYDLSKAENYAFIATGDNYDGTSEVRKHKSAPLISKEKINFLSKKVYYFEGFERKVQIHAILVTIGWMFFAGVGIVVMRHGRSVFIRSCANKAMWYWIHIICQLCAFFMGLAGIIFITVSNGEWEKGATQTHGALGLVATSFGLLNIVMGIFRPEPESKWRHVFNMVHRYNGMLGFLFAIITMWLGVFLYEIPDAFKYWGTIVLAIWTVSQALLMILFECKRSGAVLAAKSGAEFEKSINLDVDPNNAEVKGKFVRHVNSIMILGYVALSFSLCAAFWAGLFLH